MPCYTVQTLSVEFQAKHADLLEAAARALGFRVRAMRGRLQVDEVIIDFNTGQASYRQDQATKAQEKIDLLKRQYSIEAIKTAATKTGWSKSQVARLNARRKVNKLTVTRR